MCKPQGCHGFIRLFSFFCKSCGRNPMRLRSRQVHSFSWWRFCGCIAQAAITWITLIALPWAPLFVRLFYENFLESLAENCEVPGVRWYNSRTSWSIFKSIFADLRFAGNCDCYALPIIIWLWRDGTIKRLELQEHFKAPVAMCSKEKTIELSLETHQTPLRFHCFKMCCVVMCWTICCHVFGLDSLGPNCQPADVGLSGLRGLWN